MLEENRLKKYYGYEIAEMVANRRIEIGTKLIDQDGCYYIIDEDNDICNCTNGKSDGSFITSIKLYDKRYNFVIEEKIDVSKLEIGTPIQVKLGDKWINRYFLGYEIKNDVNKENIFVYAGDIKLPKNTDIYAKDEFTNSRIIDRFSCYDEFRLYNPSLDR